MSNVRFIGCLHFGHHWMALHRNFMDVQQHDETLITEWNKVVHKKDLTWILGDITMETDEHYYQLDRLNGRKKIVLGNHDLPEHTRKLLDYCETVAGVVDYKGYVLSHVPIHPNEISFCRGNIHAHIHHVNRLSPLTVIERYGDPYEGATTSETLHKYFNVDAYLVNFRPQSIEDLLEARKPVTFDI